MYLCKSNLLILLLLSCLGACHSLSSTEPAHFSFNTSLELRLYESVFNPQENVLLTWKNIKDKRCPENDACKEKGEATLSFEIIKGELKGNIKFVIPGQCYEQTGKCGDTQEWANYIISLIHLNNHPQKGERTRMEDYILKLKIKDKLRMEN